MVLTTVTEIKCTYVQHVCMRTYLESMNVKRAGAAPADTTALHTYSTVRIKRKDR